MIHAVLYWAGKSCASCAMRAIMNARLRGCMLEDCLLTRGFLLASSMLVDYALDIYLNAGSKSQLGQSCIIQLPKS